MVGEGNFVLGCHEKVLLWMMKNQRARSKVEIRIVKEATGMEKHGMKTWMSSLGFTNRSNESIDS